jgi:hypothetical protein
VVGSSLGLVSRVIPSRGSWPIILLNVLVGSATVVDDCGTPIKIGGGRPVVPGPACDGSTPPLEMLLGYGQAGMTVVIPSSGGTGTHLAWD